MYGLLQRAWLLAFSGEKHDDGNADLDDAAVGAEDFAKQLGRRMKKATAFLQQDANVRASVIAAVASEPIDTLVLQLLHLDVEGKLLLDIVSKPHLDPIRIAQVRLAAMLRNNVAGAFLVRFHITDALNRAECFSSLRSVVVEFAAAIHYRLSVFGRWPYKLLRLVVPGLLTASQRNNICREFFAKDECCLDKYFSLRLRKWAQPAHAAQRPSGLTSPKVLGLLRAWGEKGKISIAHVERMHRANNDAFHPAKGCRVTAEAGVTMALLRAKMKSHLKRGRDDFTKCKNMRQYAES